MTTNLKYSTTKTKAGKTYKIDVRLDDQCKNGHQDFSITGSVYIAGKPMTDTNMISCGAIGDVIASNFPEFAIFNRLHLCDLHGIPMHAIANGYYHLKNGFNNTPTNSIEFRNEYCKYYRLTSEQFDTIATANSEVHFAYLLSELKIFTQWESEAKIAISFLEELTGETFENNSTKSQLHMPADEKIQEELKKIDNGFYSKEQKEARRNAQLAEKFAKMKSDLQTKHEIEIKELNIKMFIIETYGEEIQEQIMFYNYNNSIGFNWRSYGKKIDADTCKEIYNVLNEKFVLNGYTTK
jgi:hypothetical protein